MESAREIFEAELAYRGIEFRRQEEDGVYEFDVKDGAVVRVSLDNIERDYRRDGDADAVVYFVDQILGAIFETPPPPWEQARFQVYFSAQPADYDFGDTLMEAVTDTVRKVLVVTDPDKGLISWITPEIIRDWGVSENEVRDAALSNLARLLHGVQLEIDDIDGMKLGMIPVDTTFKASLVFAPNFKDFVSPALGWPVLAVIPCRDFIYILSESDSDLFDRIGRIVQKEYRDSGYSITTEVLRISDDGIESIGAFPE